MTSSVQGESKAPGADLGLADLVAEITDRLLAGEPVDLEEYVARRPELAEQLRRLVPALAVMHEVGSASGPGRADAASADAVVARSPDHATPASGVLGDFRIIREAGRGGMGVVYEAEQLSLRRRVALKVLPFAATMDPRHLQRFQNEARAAACLHHGNIVPVYSVGCERGVYFYAMQFIDGQTLTAVIRELQRPAGQVTAPAPADADPDVPTTAHIPPDGSADSKADTDPAARQSTLATLGPARGREYFRRVAELGEQAAEALDHAHQLGIVHRDVKPGNLLLDVCGNLWVADFGVAHMQHGEASLTMTGDLVGTLRYMSPEQALAKRVPIDHRTDVYSLGATLYELLTLRPAFEGKDRQEVLRQIAFEEPKPPRRIARAVPAELEVIVLKAMAKNPVERYATAQEMADDLRRFLNDKPIRARRPSWAKVAIKWARRHRTVVWAAAAVLLLAAALAGGCGVWRLQQQAAAAREAELALKEAGRLQEEDKWPEALWMIRRAEPLLSTDLLGEGLRHRIEERLADLKMVDRLEQIRLQKAALNRDVFDFAQAVDAYRDAFREYGIDVTALSVEETVGRIRTRGIRVELAAALDDWADVCRDTRMRTTADGFLVGPSASGLAWANGPVLGSKELLALARAVDPDELRTRLRDALERGDAEALKEVAASGQVARLPPSTLLLLGQALGRTDSVEQAVAVLRDGQKRHSGNYWINYELACQLRQLGPAHLEEAARYFTAAVALRPLSPVARFSLGLGLAEYGRLDEAIAEYREAIELEPDYAEAHGNLGNALWNKGRLEEAGTERRMTIELEPAVFQNVASMHLNLDNALCAKGRLDEAVAEFREAMRLTGDYPEAHCSLGFVLEGQGQFRKALREMKCGHELGSRRMNPPWPYMSASAAWVQALERFADLDDKLPAVLSGEARLADASERLTLGEICQMPFKKLYAASARFYGEAFAEKPQLADDVSTEHRYHAACAAALAGCGQGKDAGSLDELERAFRLRRQALEWLRPDLTAWKPLLSSPDPMARTQAVQVLAHWRVDDDLAGVRDADALSKLPDGERAAWRQLWADLDALLPTPRP